MLTPWSYAFLALAHWYKASSTVHGFHTANQFQDFEACPWCSAEYWFLFQRLNWILCFFGLQSDNREEEAWFG